jgi:hypothetical protein
MNIRRSRHGRPPEAIEKYILWHYKRRRQKIPSVPAVFYPDPVKNQENHQNFGKDGLGPFIGGSLPTGGGVD